MAEDSLPVVIPAANGVSSVVYGDLALYSRFDPRSAPERAAASVTVLPETLYLVPSPLLGYGLEILLSRLPASSAVLALEADPRLEALTLARLPEGVQKHPRFFFRSGAPSPTDAMRGLGRFRRCLEVCLSFGRRLRADYYDETLRGVESEVTRYWRNRMTMIHMGRLWTRNLVRNLGELARGDIRPPARWDAPIVVCGAGPSLDSLCPWIAAERSRLRVLACDTALGPLIGKGIRPDAVVCLEGQIHNLKDFLCLGKAEMPLYIDLTSHPSAFHSIRGPKIVTLTRFEELGFLDRLEARGMPFLRVPPLGSVGVLAARIARILTDGPIFLAGLDFSFPSGRTHALYSPAILRETLQETRLYKGRSQWATSYASDTWQLAEGDRSGTVLSSYSELLASEIALDPRFVDIRPSGLPLGLSRSSLRDASAILDGFSPMPGPGLGFPVGPTLPAGTAALGAKAHEFLSGELDRVMRLREALRSAQVDLPSLVADCDWLYSWFPDEHRVLGLPGDIRNRLLAEVVDWGRRLGEALGDLEEARAPHARHARPPL